VRRIHNYVIAVLLLGAAGYGAEEYRLDGLNNRAGRERVAMSISKLTADDPTASLTSTLTLSGNGYFDSTRMGVTQHLGEFGSSEEIPAPDAPDVPFIYRAPLNINFGTVGEDTFSQITDPTAFMQWRNYNDVLIHEITPNGLEIDAGDITLLGNSGLTFNSGLSIVFNDGGNVQINGGGSFTTDQGEIITENGSIIARDPARISPVWAGASVGSVVGENILSERDVHAERNMYAKECLIVGNGRSQFVPDYGLQISSTGNGTVPTPGYQILDIRNNEYGSQFSHNAAQVGYQGSVAKVFSFDSTMHLKEDLATSGTITAGGAGFIGGGAGLTALNGTNIASGTVADARLSANVAQENVANVFTAAQTVPSLTINGTGKTGIATILAATSGISITGTWGTTAVIAVSWKGFDEGGGALWVVVTGTDTADIFCTNPLANDADINWRVID
jgi:hypothetical protein